METISSKDNKSGTSYIAFFDLDGTIIGANSGKALVRQAYNTGMMSFCDLVKAVYLSIVYRTHLKGTRKVINDMIYLVAGLPEKSILKLSSDVAANVLIPSIRSEVIAELIYHREQNTKVVILSSALKPVCLKIGNHLAIDDIICSELEVSNGHYTGRPLGRLCFDEEKAERLKEYCEINNTDLGNAWYYADSIDDKPALSIVGHPVCINPDKKLKKIALEKKWKIYQWH